MVQFSLNQTRQGPQFDAPVSGDGGYAWWYIDAISDDGIHGLTLIAFIGSVFSPYYAWSGWANPLDHCAVNVALYRLDGARGRWAMTERRASSLSRNATELSIGPSHLVWETGGLTVTIDEICAPIPSRVKGTIRLIPEVMTEAAFDLDPAGHHQWRPLAPRARVELDLSHPALSWSGDGYFDTNHGTEPLERAFTHWHWGRAHRGNDLRIFYDVIYPNQREEAAHLSVSKTGDVTSLAPLAHKGLSSSFWGIRRKAWCDHDAPVSVLKTLEDTPFYARSALSTSIEGERVTMMHETLNLERLRQPIIRAMLPFRMPRSFR
jgi:carotenoid 1,2-hydratase